jgi:hypothetical protein
MSNGKAVMIWGPDEVILQTSGVGGRIYLSGCGSWPLHEARFFCVSRGLELVIWRPGLAAQPPLPSPVWDETI